MALLLEFRSLREIGEKSTGNVKPSEDRQGRQGLCQGRHCLPCLIAGYVPETNPFQYHYIRPSNVISSVAKEPKGKT